MPAGTQVWGEAVGMGSTIAGEEEGLMGALEAEESSNSLITDGGTLLPVEQSGSQFIALGTGAPAVGGATPMSASSCNESQSCTSLFGFTKSFNLPETGVEKTSYPVSALPGQSIEVIVAPFRTNAEIWSSAVAPRLLATGKALCSANHSVRIGALVLIGTRTGSVLEADSFPADDVAPADALSSVHHQHFIVRAEGRRLVDLPVPVVVVVVPLSQSRQQEQQQHPVWHRRLLQVIPMPESESESDFGPAQLVCGSHYPSVTIRT